MSFFLHSTQSFVQLILQLISEILHLLECIRPINTTVYQWYCWWFRNPANQVVDSLSTTIYHVFYTSFQSLCGISASINSRMETSALVQLQEGPWTGWTFPPRLVPGKCLGNFSDDFSKSCLYLKSSLFALFFPLKSLHNERNSLVGWFMIWIEHRDGIMTLPILGTLKLTTNIYI